jgi:hypothetical protein
MVSIFSNTGAKEILAISSINEKYFTASSGIQRARYELLRPDNPALAHIWTGTYNNSFTMTIDKDQVTVTMEDVLWTGT